jgi:hypothetical protein
MKSSKRKCTSAAGWSDPAPLISTPRRHPTNGTTAYLFTSRLTIDVTPEPRGRIEVSAFQRGVTVANMLRGLLARGFADKAGDAA